MQFYQPTSLHMLWLRRCIQPSRGLINTMYGHQDKQFLGAFQAVEW